MKILCLSDTVDPVVYSKYVKERYKDVDLILSAGDLPLKYYGFLLSTLNKDLYFVFGNHNLELLGRYVQESPVPRMGGSYADELMPEYLGEFVDGKVKYDKKHDLIIAGLGGSMRYNLGRHQFTENEMHWRIVKMIPRLLWNKLVHGRYVDILVTHAPPAGVHDEPDLCHKGFDCFHWFIRKFKPKYLIHGHVHLYDMNAKREDRIGDTTVINVYDRYVIDDPTLGRKK